MKLKSLITLMLSGLVALVLVGCGDPEDMGDMPEGDAGMQQEGGSGSGTGGTGSEGSF